MTPDRPAPTINLPIRALPILEQWDCHACGQCCRGHTVPLDREDLARLQGQHWRDHPDFKHQEVITWTGFWRNQPVLAQRADGSCVFLTPQGRCKVHEVHGEPAKPWPCRMYPFQLIPVDTHIKLTMRRSCPSAAEHKGRPLSQHQEYVERLAPMALPAALGDKTIAPPPITGNVRRDWPTTHEALRGAETIIRDSGRPLVFRLARLCRWADLLAAMRYDNVDDNQLRELLRTATALSDNELATLFRERAAPTPIARVLFRQTAAEYLRFHPNLGDRPGLLERLRLLVFAARMTWGVGKAPPLHPSLPTTTFAALDRPLGPLPMPVLEPLDRYFQAMIVGLQYCGAGYFGWSIVDGARALAIAFAVALWALRWWSTGREPTADDMARVVCMLDRSHNYPLLASPRHRRRLAVLADQGQLDRLLAWSVR